MEKRRTIPRTAAIALVSVLAVGAGATALVRPWGPSVGDEPVRLVEIPTPPPPVTVVESLEPGETLADVFGDHGFSGTEIFQVVDAIREFQNPRRLRPGTEIRLARRPSGPPARVTLQLDPDRTLYLVSDDAGGGWSARLDSVAVVHDTIAVAGRVKTNLYDAEMFGGMESLAPRDRNDLVRGLSEIYQWQIDFWRNVDPGDAYRAVVAREVRPDGTTRSARILMAEFRNRGRLLRAVRFQPDASRPVEYYDGDGQALRGQFLLAPLDFARVTSGFSMRRFHPVLRRRRPHLGIDYGASRGTSVLATGAGVVTRAGRWGSYGIAIEVRHANNLRTRYAHLSGVARGIVRGTRVEQGQVIGYVGSTGLATGSHLHYEFLRDGRHVNPASMQFPRADPVPAELRAGFEATRDRAMALLSRVPLPAAGGPASARTQD